MLLRSFRTTFILLALISAFAGAGTVGEIMVAAAPDMKEVKIDNFSFTPPELSVPVGTQIRWTNRDDIPHTVTTDDKTIKSKVMDTDEQFTYTFDKPGTYKYFCSIHPKMTGTVVVQ
jgi:plastocyanin